MADQPPAQAAEADEATIAKWAKEQSVMLGSIGYVARAYLALQRQKEAAEQQALVEYKDHQQTRYQYDLLKAQNEAAERERDHYQTIAEKNGIALTEEMARQERLLAALAASRAQARAAVEALRPFVEFADAVDARYRKRGGKPESFPDTHPFADIRADQLTCGVWRRARECLAALPKEGE